MQGRCGNIYKAARKAAGMTQEQAAELLHISVRSLAEYEAGRTIPPDDVVCRMIEVYKADWLAYKHLKQTEIGNRYLPNIDSTDLAKSVLRLQKEVRDFQVISNEIIDIACQGMIKEHDKWRSIVEKINGMVGAALSVVFHQTG